MDFGLKFEVIKALQKALNEFLRIVGGGYKNRIRKRQLRLKGDF